MIETLTRPNPRAVAAGLTVLRVVVGLVFLVHGLQKVFQFTIPGTVGAFGEMGVPLAGLVAPVITILELVGGGALILGLFTRIVAPLLAIDVLGALLVVHLPAGFFLPNGYEFVLTLAGASLALTLAGPGALALDNWFARRAAVDDDTMATSTAGTGA